MRGSACTCTGAVIKAARFRRRRGSGQIGSTLTGADQGKYRRQPATRASPGDRPPRHGACSGLGVHRWVVEQSIALLHWFRRLQIRWEIRDDIREAFLSLACAIICWCRPRNLSLC